MGKRGFRALSALIASLAMVAANGGPGFASPPPPSGSGDNPAQAPFSQSLENQLNDEAEARLLALDSQFIASRTAGDNQLSAEQAGLLRSQAVNAARQLARNAPPPGPTTFNSPWSNIGPDPILQIARSDNAVIPVTGRIGALAIRKDGTFILGAAQGGIWTFDPTTGNWIDRTDNLPSLATGALAIAPSNDSIVYDGTGEGALSGDSYFGNGILKSTDGGVTWAHVSGDYFLGVSISRLAVDPNDAGHLYATVLRGRGGAHRVSPPLHSAYGIWESHDGGVSWTLLMAAPAGSLGATDIRLDPRAPSTLYASFWGDKIYKSTNGGGTWAPIMNGLPTNGNFAGSLTRFNLGLSHPAGEAHATLYTGFSYTDTSGTDHPGRVWKSTDDGASWSITAAGSGNDDVEGYCGTQCFYDNVIEVDPNNTNIVYAGGSFGY